MKNTGKKVLAAVLGITVIILAVLVCMVIIRPTAKEGSLVTKDEGGAGAQETPAPTPVRQVKSSSVEKMIAEVDSALYKKRLEALLTAY